MNMKDNLLAEAIANYMVVEGCARTTSGNHIFDFSDLAEHFGITADKVGELKEDIESRLADCPQVMDEDGIWVDDDSFNIMFCKDFCAVED